MRENADQNNSEYGQFSRNVNQLFIRISYAEIKFSNNKGAGGSLYLF